MNETRWLTVRSTSPLLTDRGVAAIIRQQYLDRQAAGEPQRPLGIDLNGIRIMSVEAADELVGRFIERRREYSKAPVFVRAMDTALLQTVHAALRDSRLNALAALPPQYTRAVGIGFFSKPEFDVLRAVGDHDQITAHDVIGAGVQVANVEGLLDGLLERGVLVKHGEAYQVPLPSPIEDAVPA